MVYNLYNNNEKFNELINNYTTLYITKSTHSDRIENYKNFTGFFYDNYTGVKTCCYHFYVKKIIIYTV